MNVGFSALLQAAFQQSATAKHADGAGTACGAATRCLGKHACKNRRTACDHLALCLGLQLAQCDGLFIAGLSPLLIGTIHVLGKARVVALKCVDKDIVALPQTAHAVQHGIILCR